MSHVDCVGLVYGPLMKSCRAVPLFYSFQEPAPCDVSDKLDTREYLSPG